MIIFLKNYSFKSFHSFCEHSSLDRSTAVMDFETPFLNTVFETLCPMQVNENAVKYEQTLILAHLCAQWKIYLGF